ncbi:MAG: hemolysin family protein [Porphyromonas sp.]|nr:hemolysin family protein [Porphyromonas sp.]
MIYLFIILCIFLQAFFNTSEISFLAADRLQVELDKSEGSLNSRIQDFIFHRIGRFITTVLVGNNIINVIYGLLVAMVLEPMLSQVIANDFLVILIQALISSAFVIIFSEYIPKAIAQTRPNQQMRLVALPLFLSYWLLYPIILIATILSNLVFRILGVKNKEGSIIPFSKVDLDYYIENKSSSDDDSYMSETKILQNAIEFSDIKVRDCLVPRNEVSAVDLDTTIEELIRLFDNTGFSKIMVYKETVDDIVGYIHAIEMYKCNEEGTPWQQHVKQTVYLPETLACERALRTMLHKRRSIAVVVDELGGTAGIVTLEDLMEEIFGDIEDEHDTKRIIMNQVSEDEYVISGRAEIDTLNEMFKLDIPESDDYKTLAGYILYHNQGIPTRGEELALPQHIQAKILRATDNKITLVRLKKAEI